MLDSQLRSVERVFARHPKSYRFCESCSIHEAAVRAIWATPLSRISGAQIEWMIEEMSHFDHDAIGYYWPAIMTYLVREPGYGAWWECLFTRLYLARARFTSAEHQAIGGVLMGLVTEPVVQPVDRAIITAFLAFWLEDTESVLQVVTERIQQTWRELLAEQTCRGHQGEVEHLWSLAQLRKVPQGLYAVTLERCLLLEELLVGPRAHALRSPGGMESHF